MLATLGVEAGARVEVGSPARVITRLAAEYDITVVGAHDQYTRSKPGLGPVASRVVAAAPGAVLIGRELGEEGRQWRILAAVNGSLASERALEVLSSSLQIGEAEITLLSVAETPWVNLGLDREWFEYPAARRPSLSQLIQGQSYGARRMPSSSIRGGVWKDTAFRRR